MESKDRKDLLDHFPLPPSGPRCDYLRAPSSFLFKQRALITSDKIQIFSHEPHLLGCYRQSKNLRNNLASVHGQCFLLTIRPVCLGTHFLYSVSVLQNYALRTDFIFLGSKIIAESDC